MKTHIMIDIETMGTRVGCAIVSIGAVAFDPKTGEVFDKFYKPISLGSNETFELRIEADTVKWWLGQSEAARKEVSDGESLYYVLERLEAFFEQFEEVVAVWGMGNFDAPFIREAYRVCQLTAPWNYRIEHCYRTVRQLLGHTLTPDIVVDCEAGLIAHKAIDDAVYQTRILTEIFKANPSLLA